MTAMDLEVEATTGLSVTQLLEVGQKFDAKGETQSAIHLYEIWLRRNANIPLSYVAWYEFGRMLGKAGNADRAAASFQAAIEQKPDFTEAAVALGYALEGAAKPNEALEVWRQCIKAGGDKVVLLNNIGRVCDGTYQHEGAETALKESWKLNSDQPDVISTLLHLRQRLCEWPIMAPDLGLVDSEAPHNFGPIASLAMFNDPVQNLESVRTFLRLKGYDQIKPLPIHKTKKQGKQKIRVGFLSADYRMHATSVFFGTLLEKLDRSVFEVYALDITVAKEVFGSVRDGLLRKVDHHVPLQSLNDEEAIKQVRSLQLDVVVDMAGLTAGARPAIVANRIAPVQVAYLGFIGSSGMASMDYIMTAPDLYQTEHAAGYCEAPLHLSGPYFAMNEDLVDLGGHTLTREQCGLPANAFVYCALLNTYKITKEVFDSWLRILKRVEHGVLWLVSENPTVVKNLTQYASQNGVDASRLIFTPRVHPAQFRSYLKCADVFLDTAPYGNGATAREAILANLPILTLPGNTMMSRLSGHLMKRLGMDDFVVDSRPAYEEFAVTLGQSPALMAEYKDKMMASRASSELFDAELFVEQFGEALQKAYQA